MIYFIPVTPCNSKSFILFYPSWGLTARHSTTSHENYPKKYSPPREDKLRYRYASNKIDEVWTGDVTELSTYSLLLYVDMTTRQIIGHLLRKKGLITGNDCAELFRRCAADRQLPTMFHTDSASIFSSKEMFREIYESKVLHSVGNQAQFRHHNQVQERLHRTLKLALRKRLKELKGLKQVPKTLKKLSSLSIREVCNLVQKVIESYNDTVHGRLKGASPNRIESAISLYGNEVSTQVFGSEKAQLSKENSTKGTLIGQFRAEVVRRYAGDWQKFFIHWYQKSEMQHQEVMRSQEAHTSRVIAALQQEKLGLIQEIETSRKAIQDMQTRLEKQERDLTFLRNREESREIEKREKAEARARRAARNRTPRSAAYFLDYEAALKCVTSKKPFIKARDRVALLLLYITGIKVASLLLFTVSDLKTLRQFAKTGEGQLRIPSHKRTDTREDFLPLPPIAKQLVTDRLEDIDFLIDHHSDETPVFHTEEQKKVLRRDVLNRNINEILKEASRQLNKKLQTHSFRIGLITSITEDYGSDAAQHIIGHANVATTSLYARRHIRQRDISRMLNSALKPKNTVLRTLS